MFAGMEAVVVGEEVFVADGANGDGDGVVGEVGGEEMWGHWEASTVAVVRAKTFMFR